MPPAPGCDENDWSAWSPRQLARRLAGVTAPWCIAGGWALDLWHGAQTRTHEDIEFTVLAEDLPAFRQALAGMEFHTAHAGVLAPLPGAMEPPAHVAQIWCRDVEAGCWRADMMIERGTPATWVYKRDPAITCARDEAVGRTPDGLPYLKPAIVLLFKARHRRPKDEADFASAVPRLSVEERRRLKAWLARAHPGHDWGAAL
ncbi:nucleotidyltransferase domain-containing protein [Ancylobacter oerskovii]|uniref:Nucleotidyltransferase domain-containing protein n=1 Tax=Ancylobacter oerskovii TaxID=459519 RepID=A0ABW4Z4I1_9HYPH|nr:amino acid transporter [Ancylobacter oerskovii]MBS7546011.1 amino acid transporter [Ancylobacter oerskovii]